VEDQQPAAGDLTETAPDEQAPDAGAVEETQPAETQLDETPEAEAAPAPAKEPSRAGKWFARNKKIVAVATSAALFVAAGAFAGAAVQPYLMDRAAVDTKLDIARTAANAITTLWTYTPDDMDKLADRSAKFLSGDFQDQYRKYVDAIAPTNKQANVTNNTEVVGAAVESLRGSEATAIVFTNTTSTSPLSKGIPSMRYLSYRLQLKRQGARWLVTKMTTVTSLDLTPQI
jgi:Mce-associated membrane protein